MAFDSNIKRVRVFVSSPGDVREERKMTEEVLGFLQAEFSGLLCIDPLFWENETQFGPAENTMEPPSQADLFICILWSRLGTRLHAQEHANTPNSANVSGTEFEFKDAMAAFQKTRCPHLMLFKREADITIPTEPPNEYQERTAQRKALHDFFEKWTKDEEHGDVYSAGFNMYKDTAEFKAKLTKYLRQYFQGLLPEQTGIKRAVAWKGSPFRGLEHFDFEHAPIFKGRAAVTGEILLRLKQQCKANKPFILIGGSSGVGKSSLVRAGLLRLLLNQYQDWHAAAWQYGEMRPSDTYAAQGSVSQGGLPEHAARKEENEQDFFMALAHALTQQRRAELTIEDGAQSLRRPPSALPQLLDIYNGISHLAQALREDVSRVVLDMQTCLKELKAQHYADGKGRERQGNDVQHEVRFCLLLDQLEEFFTTAQSTVQKRNAFFATLRALVEGGVMVVVATIRADYLSHCEDVPDLQYLKDGNSYYHLSPPSKLDIRAIIREPAQAAGLSFESSDDGSLDERIRQDVQSYDRLGQGATVLPLVEFTLTELYEKAKEEQGLLQLSFTHYEAMGGLQGAIATKADETFAAFCQSHGPKAERIFADVMRHLVAGSQEGVFTRQKASRAVLEALDGGKAFVDAFVASRLFIVEAEALHHGSQGAGHNHVSISIVHEALLLHWQYLHAWLEQEREYFAIVQRVQTAYALWHKEKEGKDLLLPEGKSLRDAEYVRQGYEGAFTAQELRFIALSKKHAERQKRRLQMLVVALIVGVIAAIAMFYDARVQEQKAVVARDDAEDLASFILFDLHEKLRPLGQLALMDSMYREVDKYYAKQSAPPTDMVQHKKSALSSQQGDVLRAMGKNAEALALYEKSLAVSQELAAKEPHNALWQRDVSVALDRMGYMQKLLGHDASALEYYKQSLLLRRALATQSPQENVYQEELSVSLVRVGDTLRDTGHSKEALLYYEESLAIDKLLAKREPHNLKRQRELSVALGRVGDIFTVQKKYMQALDWYIDSLDISLELQKKDEKNTLWSSDAATSLEKLAVTFVALGDFAKAKFMYEKSLSLRRGLVQHDPLNAQWQQAMVNLFVHMGDALYVQKHFAQALDYYTQGLENMRSRLQRNPSNTDWQEKASFVLGRVGKSLQELHKPEEALLALQEALQLRRTLAAKEPQIIRWQRNLAVALQNVGEALQEQKALAKALPNALRHYDESLQVYEKLAKADKEPALSHVNDMSARITLLSKKGDVLQIMGELDQALAAYAQSLALSKSYAKQERTVAWQWEVAMINGKAFDLARTVAPAQAKQYLAQVVTMLEELSLQEPKNTLFTTALKEFSQAYASLYGAE